ncbi:MAG TPA: hypothetical protein VGD14_05275, partial [bacterium]
MKWWSPLTLKQNKSMAKSSAILGIDIGGTGIKAALVDSAKGILQSRVEKLATPRPATAEA